MVHPFAGASALVGLGGLFVTDGIASPVLPEFLEALLSDFFPPDFYPFFLGDLFGDLELFAAFSFLLSFGVSKSISSMTNYFCCFFLFTGDSSCAAPVASICFSKF